jgi:hypothetical protein
MAIKYISSEAKYTALSTDDLSVLKNPPADAKLYLTDIKAWKIYDGAEWVDFLYYSSALPTGSATSAKQDIGNSSLSSIDTKIGEVQATPTANTVLGRLKDIVVGLGSVVLATGSAIIGKVGIDQTEDGATNKVQARNSAHDDFNVNANLQINNADASSSNPAPVRLYGQKDTDGSLGELGSFILDSNSRPVQRIVDVAPWDPPVTTITLYHVTLTNADTEYSQALPANTRHISVMIMDGVSTDNFRVAYVTNKVATPTAPYLKFAQNMQYVSPDINVQLASSTIYIASSVGSKTAIIEVWS